MSINCEKRVEGGQWVCNRCGYVWDMSDDDPPKCKTDTPSDYVSESLGSLVAQVGEEGLSRCQLINGVWHGWKR